MQKVLKAFISGLSQKEKMVLYVACVAVGLAIFDRLLLGPIMKETKNIEERIQAQITNTKKNLTILQYKDKIINEDDAYNIFYTKKGLSQDELIAVFLSEVEVLAKASGIALTNINPVMTEEKKGFVQYSLTIECAGNMKNILDFIYGIENSKKPIRVVSYEISPKTRETYDVKCTITVIKMMLTTEDNVSK
jgi:Tfp pilus assembly protein PilO